MSDSNFPLPPPTFEFLIVSLKMQAEMQLGLLKFGGDQDRSEVNIQGARHTIDLLAMIQEKTVNNLSLDEKRLIDNSLTELRFRFIQAGKSSAGSLEEDATTHTVGHSDSEEAPKAEGAAQG